MRTEGSLESRINNLCSIAGYTEEEMQKLGTKLLRIFRDVCRNNKLDADDSGGLQQKTDDALINRRQGTPIFL